MVQMDSEETAMKKPRSVRPKKPAQKRRVHLITGATSGIGIWLAKRLLERGDEVRVLLRSHPSTSESWKGVPSGVIPYVADITLKHHEDQKVLQDACKGIDSVFHLASMTDYEKASFDDFVNINVVGTENVLKACIDTNPEDRPIRVLYISSTRVYGTKRPGEILTEESATKPVDSYGETKLMAEQVVKSFADAHTCIGYTIFRTSTIYGPHYEKAAFRLLKMVKEQKMRYIGGGANHLVFVHVDDVVDAFLAALDNPQAVDKTYNLSDGNAYTLRQVIDTAADSLKVPKPTKSVSPALARLAAKMSNMSAMDMDFLMSDRVVSIGKLKKELNFTPRHSLESEAPTTLKEFTKYYKE